jgi:predicted PurR-regulated permease PerM
MPFIVGFILAYLLLPIIRWFEKHLVAVSGKPRLKQLKRITIIVVVYLLSLVVIGGVIFYIVIVIGNVIGTLTLDMTCPR